MAAELNVDEAAGNIREHWKYQGFFAQIALQAPFCFVFPPLFMLEEVTLAISSRVYARATIVQGIYTPRKGPAPTSKAL